jgi:hypothetical protein
MGVKRGRSHALERTADESGTSLERAETDGVEVRAQE